MNTTRRTTPLAAVASQAARPLPDDMQTDVERIMEFLTPGVDIPTLLEMAYCAGVDRGRHETLDRIATLAPAGGIH